MDGARLMNAAVAQRVQPARIARHCDSVSLCFSKVCPRGEGSPGLAGGSTNGSLAPVCRCWAQNSPGGAAGVTRAVLQGLGAPCGAVLAGSSAFIEEAWRARKLLGGGMRQAGVLAAAAALGLRRAEETLRRDHEHARSFAQGTAGPGGVGQHTWHCPATLGLAAWAPSLLGVQPGEDVLGSSPAWRARIMPGMSPSCVQ